MYCHMKSSIRNKKTIAAVTLLLPAACLLLLSSCSRQQEPQPPPQASAAWSSLASPDADLILVADIDALRKSAWYQNSQMQKSAQQDALVREAGFSQDNVSMLLISSDLDSLPQLSSLQPMTAADANPAAGMSSLQSNLLAELNTSMFLLLDREISWNQAREAARIIFSSINGTVISENPEKPQLIVRQDTSPVPLFITLSADNRILELRTAEHQAPSVERHPSIASFIEEDSRLQANGPVRAIMLTSSAMQKKIREGISAAGTGTPTDPSASMMSGLLKPFTGLKGISLALNPQTDHTSLYCSIDVDTSDNASSAEAIMQSVLLPLITLALSQQAQGLPPNLITGTKTSITGSRVILEAVLNTKAADEISPQNQ